MILQNKALYEAHGIPRWWDAGYDGSLGLTMSFERFPITPYFNGKVERLFEDVSPFFETWDDRQRHGFETAMLHLDVAPGRKIVQVPFNHSKAADGTISGFLVDTLLPWMLTNKPDTGYRSLDGTGGFDSVFGKITGFCTLLNAAGNNGDEDYAGIIQDKAWLGVAATHFDGGKFIPEYYSSESQYVDFAADGAVYVADVDGSATWLRGTSLAAPMLSAMLDMVNHYFIKNVGRSLSQAEMYDFVKPNCVDIGIPGKDPKTGWGTFVMPDPKTIDLKKVLKDTPITVPVTPIQQGVVLTIGSKTYTVDGVEKQMNTAPFIKDDRTFVPIRFIAEALGCTVQWDSGKVTITK